MCSGFVPFFCPSTCHLPPSSPSRLVICPPIRLSSVLCLLSVPLPAHHSQFQYGSHTGPAGCPVSLSGTTWHASLHGGGRTSFLVAAVGWVSRTAAQAAPEHRLLSVRSPPSGTASASPSVGATPPRPPTTSGLCGLLSSPADGTRSWSLAHCRPGTCLCPARVRLFFSIPGSPPTPRHVPGLGRIPALRLSSREGGKV